ncbi:MAG: hypothetical protein J1F11_04305 [Oscillospiraceae bacterium]|nr:hypothetical protein [Oscillospiraceae bacterium]
MSKSRCVIMIILGLFLSGLSIVMFVHDAEYIFTGNTVNLNEILQNNEELPRDKYVTFTCEFPIDNYAETQQYLNGFIPLPFKTQQYAMLGDNGMIFSAEVGKKAKIAEMDQAIETFYDDGTVSVTLTGNLQINSPEMDSYLQECAEYIFGDDLETYGFFLTSYVIDTTKTRSSQALLYIFLLLIGVVCIGTGIRSLRR